MNRNPKNSGFDKSLAVEVEREEMGRQTPTEKIKEK